MKPGSAESLRLDGDGSFRASRGLWTIEPASNMETGLEPEVSVEPASAWRSPGFLILPGGRGAGASGKGWGGVKWPASPRWCPAVPGPPPPTHTRTQRVPNIKPGTAELLCLDGDTAGRFGPAVGPCGSRVQNMKPGTAESLRLDGDGFWAGFGPAVGWRPLNRPETWKLAPETWKPA
jgi:hypothetical protein